MSGTNRDYGARARGGVPIAAALLAVAWAPASLAVMPAQVVTTAHLRAGPSTFYPIVAVLVTGTPVQLFGCEQLPVPDVGFPTVWLSLGDRQLHLFQRDTPVPALHHFAVAVDDFAANFSFSFCTWKRTVDSEM